MRRLQNILDLEHFTALMSEGKKAPPLILQLVSGLCITSATMDMSGSHDYERQSAPESTWLCIKLYCNPSRTIYQQRWCSTRGGRWDREDATKEVLWPETNCFCVSTRWKKQDSRGPGEKVYQIKSITVADIIFNGYLRYTCLTPWILTRTRF